MSAPGLPPIEAVVPHRGAMLWLESLTGGGDESVEARATVRAGAWYADEQGAMPAWIGIELMAQAVAAHVGFKSWRAGEPPRAGVLLGCRAYDSRVARFPAGAVLTVEARVAFADESGFGAYDCAIRDGTGELASAILKVYQPPDFAAFLAAAGAA